jgi:DNA-binding response OmpR family regulator
VAKIRAVMRRQCKWFTVSSNGLTWGALRLDPTLVQVTYQHELLAFTRKEYNLIEMFLKHPQRLFSRDEIIDRIWSIDESPSKAAVTNLVKDVRRKLKAVGMEQELIETVHGMGYRLMDAPVELIKKPKTLTAGYLQDIHRIRPHLVSAAVS